MYQTNAIQLLVYENIPNVESVDRTKHTARMRENRSWEKCGEQVAAAHQRTFCFRKKIAKQTPSSPPREFTDAFLKLSKSREMQGFGGQASFSVAIYVTGCLSDGLNWRVGHLSIHVWREQR